MQCTLFQRMSGFPFRHWSCSTLMNNFHFVERFVVADTGSLLGYLPWPSVFMRTLMRRTGCSKSSQRHSWGFRLRPPEKRSVLWMSVLEHFCFFTDIELNCQPLSLWMFGPWAIFCEVLKHKAHLAGLSYRGKPQWAGSWSKKVLTVIIFAAMHGSLSNFVHSHTTAVTS